MQSPRVNCMELPLNRANNVNSKSYLHPSIWYKRTTATMICIAIDAIDSAGHIRHIWRVIMSLKWSSRIWTAIYELSSTLKSDVMRLLIFPMRCCVFSFAWPPSGAEGLSLSSSTAVSTSASDSAGVAESAVETFSVVGWLSPSSFLSSRELLLRRMRSAWWNTR